jgi:lysophospholipase L1-like esterase
MSVRDTAKNLALLVAALAVSLLLAEGAVRLVLPQPLSGSWRVQTETGLLVNKSGGSARHQVDRRVVRYRFGEPHLREPGVPRPATARRILVLGDSFTFGWLLSDADTYVARLQALVDGEFGAGRFVLLNAAAGGWGTADYLFFLEDFGPQIRPDAVLVFVNTDDIGRSLASPLLKAREDGAGYVTDRISIPPSWIKQWLNAEPVYSAYQWLLEHSHLVQLVRRTAVQGMGGTTVGLADPAVLGPQSSAPAAGPDPVRPDPVEVGEALFRRMRDWCSAHHAALWVTTTGFHNPRGATTPSSEPTAAFVASAAGIFAGLGVPYHDVSPAVGVAIRAAPRDFTIPGDGHPNERAAQLIADAVYQSFLRERVAALMQP